MSTVTRNSLSALLATAILAACGSTSEDPVTPACDICSNSKFSCSHSGGLESLDLRIDSQLDDGCRASLVGVSHTSPLRIICEPPELCNSDGTCSPGDFDHNTIVIGDYTCNAW